MVKLHGWRDELTSAIEFGEIFLIRNHVQQNFHSCVITATFEKQRILKAKETCENQFDNIISSPHDEIYYSAAKER